jgi:amino-acid N-acetyltransferase
MFNPTPIERPRRPVAPGAAGAWRGFRQPLVFRQKAPPSSISFSPVAPFDFAFTSSLQVDVFSTQTNAVYRTLTRFKDVVRCASYRHDGKLLAAGALHVMWEDLAEVRSIVVSSETRGQGVGLALVRALLARAEQLGIKRVFCLTFEVGFFAKLGFEEISDVPVDEATFAEMVRSNDDGVAEFLDLARVKQNTLGNTRMLKVL